MKNNTKGTVTDVDAKSVEPFEARRVVLPQQARGQSI